MQTKLLSFVWIVFSLGIAGCSHDSKSHDSGSPTGQFERIDQIAGVDTGDTWISNIGSDDEGNIFVVMLKNWDIWVNRYEVVSGWGVPERLDTTVPLSNFPVIAVAGNGNAMAAWTHALTYDTSYFYISYYDRDLGWGEPVRLNNPNAGEASRSISISVDSEENYLIVWEQSKWVGNSQSGTIWSKKFSPLSGWQDEVIISNGAGGTAQATVRVNSSGHGFAVWGQKRGVPELFILNGARFDPLTGWGPAVEFSTTNAGPIGTLSSGVREFVVDEDGEAILTWIQDRDSSTFTYENDIFTNQYTISNGWGIPEALQIDSPGWGHGPLIGISGDGTALLTWSEGGAIPQSWYRIYNKSTGWAARQRISALVGIEINNLSVNKQGNAVAQWASYVDGKTRIFISRYTMNGNWTTSKEIDVGELQVATNVQMVLDNQNMITVTFDGYAARLSFYD